MRDYVDGIVFRLAGKTLSAAARRVLLQHRPYIVGVTGSVGKTTTKDAIAAVLAHPEALGAAVRKSLGNSNDALGVPAAILGLRSALTISGKLRLLSRGLVEARRQAQSSTFPGVLVLEYGAGSKYSNIEDLTRLARPSVAVVTAIGPAHLDRFRTVEALAEHKSALVRAVGPDGLVVLGADTPLSAAMKDVSVAPVRLVHGRGRALAHDIARIVGQHLGVPEGVIDLALAELPATEGRLSIVETALCTLIDDAYNASPLSMTLGLDTLAERASPGQHKVAILGSMAELGSQSEAFHRQVGAHARTRADMIVGVGEMARHYAGEHWFADADACIRNLRQLVRPRDIVLVKGSHSVGLPAVVKALHSAKPQ